MDFKKIAYGVLLIIFFFLGMGGGSFYFSYRHFIQTPFFKDQQPRIVLLNPGMSTREFSSMLAADGIIKHPYLFEIFIRLNRSGQALQAGEYELTPGMTPVLFLNALVKGDVVKHTIQFIEGWTFKSVWAVINAEPALKHSSSNLTSEALLKVLAIPYPSLEGLIFPDTYYFQKHTTDLAILQMAYQKLDKKLAAAWLKRAPDLVYTSPYEALIAASIIEKETGAASERPQIAGVIQRRLKKGMPLQVDASVIYGLGDNFKGDLKKADLKRETPYNTYLHRGLPPTPIAMPSEASIEAALHPAGGNDLYFVSKGDGTHFFSDNLLKHSQAVREYQIHAKKR
jgi:UPF0755 protein